MSGPADDASAFELAVLGAGVSGLCLARALLRDEAEGPSLVLFDGARDDDALRTLSFWAEGPSALDDLVTARWQTVQVVPDAGPAVRVDLRPFEYRTLFFADLQRAVKEALRAHSRHRVLDARVEAVEPAGPERVRVRSSQGDFEARWALDSRLRPADLDGRLGPHAVRLRQHFFGALVEARAGRFDPSCATLMDFRAPGVPGRAFFYLLPLDPQRALVELVSLDPLDRGDTEPLLAAYLRDRCAVSAFEVRAREAGSSPLTDGAFALRLGPRVRALGVAAGALKPSTGYALTRILDDQRALLDGLHRDGTPFRSGPVDGSTRCSTACCWCCGSAPRTGCPPSSRGCLRATRRGACCAFWRSGPGSGRSSRWCLRCRGRPSSSPSASTSRDAQPAVFNAPRPCADARVGARRGCGGGAARRRGRGGV